MTRRSQTVRGMLVSVIALTAWGQSFSGRIVGTVSDSTGGVISDAAVTVMNEGTGAQRSLKTDGQGFYVAPEIPIGYYTVRFESKGLSRIERLHVKVDVS